MNAWYEHRILEAWPGDLRDWGQRRTAQFRVDWNATLTQLENELALLKGRDVVLETAHSHDDVLMSGAVKASATPAHPGVILSFDSKHGPLRYFTDVFTVWRANVRAIGLGLEALRAVDRYGISGRGEQYTGFARLMAAKLAMTPQRAREVIAVTAGLNKLALLGVDDEMLTFMFKQAAKRAHPNAGGDRAKWDELVEAAEKLGLKVGGGAAGDAPPPAAT